MIYYRISKNEKNLFFGKKIAQVWAVTLILANSEDPDEMQHYAAFHLGLHCLLPKSYFFLSLKIVLILANNADPDEKLMLHFIWVFTVCQNPIFFCP